MKTDKNQWIDEVLHSIDDMERAVPTASLYQAIQHKLQSGDTNTPKLIPLPLVRLAVACSLLLFVFNCLAIKKQYNTQPLLEFNRAEVPATILISDYNLYEL